MVYRYRSLVIGACALLLAVLHWYTSKMDTQSQWVLVNLLEKIGLMRHDPNAVTTARSAGAFGVDAPFLVMWLGYCGTILAAVAILSALKADRRNEPTLYPAVGCALGALAISLVNPYAGFAAFVTAAILLARGRSRHGREDT
jgi:hypothetical protein